MIFQQDSKYKNKSQDPSGDHTGYRLFVIRMFSYLLFHLVIFTFLQVRRQQPDIFFLLVFVFSETLPQFASVQYLTGTLSGEFT